MTTTQVEVEVYPRGTQIVRQGSYGDCMYFVRRGKVRIYRTQDGIETTMGTVGPLEVFGEMAVFEHDPRSASAVALEETEVRVIPKSQFEAMDCDMVIRQVLNNMAHRLHDIDEGYEQLAVDAAHRRDRASDLVTQRDWRAR